MECAYLFYAKTLLSHTYDSDMMAELIESIPPLKGIDVEIFNENLNREITEEEIKSVRKWALGE